MRDLIRHYIPSADDTAVERFSLYYELLIDWNSRMNLTAITLPEEVAQKHFLDSLSALPYLPESCRVLDVGTGAGFPGIPLLIMRPDLRLTLLDSLQKRITFLKTALSELGLRAECLHARAEDLARFPEHRGSYDVTLTRAVSSLSVLLELTIPFLKIGGKSICYKGDASGEMESAKKALHLLHADCRVEDVSKDYGTRTLIICEKLSSTPSLYPRKAGIPTKNPL